MSKFTNVRIDKVAEFGKDWQNRYDVKHIAYAFESDLHQLKMSGAYRDSFEAKMWRIVQL